MFKNIYISRKFSNPCYLIQKLLDVNYMSVITLNQICNIQYISLITNLSDVL